MMKKQLLLLLSLCTAVPIVYCSEESATLAPITGPRTLQENPEVNTEQSTRNPFHYLFERSNNLKLASHYDYFSRAGKFILAQAVKGKETVKNVSLTTWTKIKTIPNSTKSLARRLWDTIWGKVPEFEEGFYLPSETGMDENEKKINGLHEAFKEVLKQEKAFYGYTIKRSVTFTGVATAIQAGVVKLFRTNPKIIALSTVILLIAEIASVRYLEKRAEPALKRIGSSWRRIATNILQARLTEDHVAAAYNRACSDTGGIFASLNPINRSSRSDLYELSEGIKDLIREQV